MFRNFRTFAFRSSLRRAIDFVRILGKTFTLVAYFLRFFERYESTIQYGTPTYYSRL